jgi:oligopeptide/dipeptide ABC transporter ATP-binding protein
LNDHILEIKNLRTSFTTKSGKIYAADGVNLSLPRGKVTALVGESGSGKSVTAMSVLKLIQEPGAVETGEILLNPREGAPVDVLKLNDAALRKVRGNKIAMIFQEPMTSLNPVYTAGDQIMEAILLHQGLGRGAARAKAVEMLKRVGIPNPERRVDSYPHELSGGMRQRVMIAMGLSCHPELLIADEPTTALDVTIQAQILELIGKLVAETGMSVLLITHDLGVVAAHAHKVAVMYAAQIVEEAATRELFKNPKHPYTKGLLDSIPSLKPKEEKRLRAIPGMVPQLNALPRGCRFQDRCERVRSDCRAADIPLIEEAGRKFRCIHPWE